MPLFYSKQNKGSKKAKTSETTSGSTHGGLNLNDEADGSGEEVQEVRPIGQDRAKTKASASSRFESSSIAGGGLIDLVIDKWKSLKSVGWEKRRNNNNLYRLEESGIIYPGKSELRDNALNEYKMNLEKAKKDRDQLKQILEKFQNSSKSLNNILESQVIDKSKTRLGYDAATAASPAVESFVNLTDKSRSDKGYHSVPPPLTGNFIPLEDKGVSNTIESNADRMNNTNAPIIEDWNSDDESEIYYTVRPSTEKIKSIKTVRETEAPKQIPRIYMEDTTGASGSSGIPSTVEKSPLDFANEDLPPPNTKGVGKQVQIQDKVSHGVPPLENPPTTEVVLESDLKQEVAAIGPLAHKKRHKREYHWREIPSNNGKAASSTITPAAQDTHTGASNVKDPDPLSYAEPQPIPEQDIAQSSKKTIIAEDPDSERSSSFTSMGGSPKKLRQLPNDEFLNQYNINLAWQVAMGSQLRLRFEHEVKLLKKSVAQVARRDQKIEAKEKQIKNLEALLEAEADMKKAEEAKNAELMKELEGLRSQFTYLQLSNQQMSQQVSTLQAQIIGEEKIKAALEEFKKYEDDRVERRCVEMDARLDKIRVDFDEDLYPHMLTAIMGRRWVIGHDLRLAVMKCGETPEPRQAFANVVSAGLVKGMSEGLEHGIEHGKAGRDLEVVEAYDPEAHSKYLKALQELKDLKYPLVDQLEGLKDAPMELIMASLHLESDSGEDAPQWIRDLRPSIS
ncbi:hypothetical protein Tco_1138823 [Tanacetum coccineum]